MLCLIAGDVVPDLGGWYHPLFLDLDEIPDSHEDPVLLDPNTPAMISVRHKLYTRAKEMFFSPKKMFTQLFYPRRAVTGSVQAANAGILNKKILQSWLRQREPDQWYMKRTRHLRMVNPNRMHRDALVWLFEVLEFQYVYRWDFYLRNFKFPISQSVHEGTWWTQLRQYHKNRASTVRGIANKLRVRADQLVNQGYLPDLIWYDPALWFFHDEVLQLLPMDFHPTSFIEAMKLAYDKEPGRSYWVDKPSQHPFYQLGLQDICPHQFSIPWRPVSNPTTALSDQGYLSFAKDIIDIRS